MIGNFRGYSMLFIVLLFLGVLANPIVKHVVFAQEFCSMLRWLCQVSGKSLLEALQSLGLTKYSEEDMRPAKSEFVFLAILKIMRQSFLKGLGNG